MPLVDCGSVALTAGVPISVDLNKFSAIGSSPCEVKLTNESPLTLLVTIGQDQHNLAAWTVDKFPLCAQTTFLVSPSQIQAPAPTGAPSNTLLVTVAPDGETIPGTFPAPLPRMGVTILAPGTAAVGSINAVLSTVTVAGTINIGNTPAVTISGTPNVNILSGTVNIGNSPSINILSQSVNLLVNLATFAVTGTVTAPNDAVTLTLNGAVSVGIIVSGGFGATDLFALEASTDGVIFVSLPLWGYFQTFAAPAPRPVMVGAISQAGYSRAGIAVSQWRADVSGFRTVRVRKVANVAGTATITLFASSATVQVARPTMDVWQGPAAATVAQAAALTLWTPAAGRRVNLMWLQVSADIAGELQLSDGAQFESINVAARQPFDHEFYEYPLLLTLNGPLTVVNNTGAATGVHAAAAGYETT